MVRHSHHYNLLQELKRHFDAGYVRTQHWKLIDTGVSDAHRGRQYVIAIHKLLMKQRPTLLPYAWAHVLAKWMGYQHGRWGAKFALSIVKRLSSQDFY